MKLLGLLPLAAALALSACGRISILPDRPPIKGDPARLIYADPGTRITVANTVNGATRETTLTAIWSLGARGKYRDEDGREDSFLPGCWGCGDGTELDEDAYAALWPLEEGKAVRFLRTGRDGEVAEVEIRVAGRQSVTTAAGTYEAYLLDGRIENRTGPTYSAQVRAWWAPAPGWVIKAEGGDSRGNTLSSEVTEVVYP